MAASAYGKQTALPVKPGQGQAAPGEQAGSAIGDQAEKNDLGALELKFFSREFREDSVDRRLLRLENFVFGAEFKGLADERIVRLCKVLRRPEEESSGVDSISGRKVAPVPAKPLSVLAQINQGIENYNKRRYHNAEDDFNEAARLAPGLSRVYAYLGITLLQLNERRAALDALEVAYELDPFGQFGRYAKNFLLVLAGDEEIRRRGPKDSLETVDKTLQKVNAQSRAEAARQLNMANSYGRGPWSFSSYLQSLRSRRDASERAASIQESANNLKDLLAAKILPGDAKLRAFGTTIHARYYGSETNNLAPYYIPVEAVPQLKAKAASLADQAAGGRKQGTARKGRSSHSARKEASKVRSG